MSYKDGLQQMQEKRNEIAELKADNLKQRQTISRQGEDIAILKKALSKANRETKRERQKKESLQQSNKHLRDLYGVR